MKIRTKIALQFTLIIAVILAVFSLSFYYLVKENRKEEFYKRLRERAEATAGLLTRRNDVNKRLLKFIDRETLSKNFKEKVSMFKKEKVKGENKLVYTSIYADSIAYNPALLDTVRKMGHAEQVIGDTTVIGTLYSDKKRGDFVVMATAYDKLGNEQLSKLRTSMIGSFLVAILATIVLGFIFAGQSLKPISVMNREVGSITAYNLRKKLDEGNRQDEIAQLAINFNLMLSRLDESFALQRSFVSHASHELRTPLAALKSEIQVALESPRNTEEYQHILQSLFNDTQRLIQLTNSLLQLAQSENKTQTIKLQPIRIDELVFDVQSEIQSFHKDYGIEIDFDEIPEQEQSVMMQGNEALLKTLFNNLIDNACKYSSNKRAKVQIGFDDTHCKVRVSDNGIGIPASEITKVFEPLYRAENARAFRGSGIGLSVCKRIVDLHQGRIEVASTEGQGTTFTVMLAHL